MKKTTLCFLVWFLVFENSSGFLPDTCNINFDPTKLFKGDVDSRDVLKGAMCVGSLLKTNYALVQKFPTTYKFIDNLIQHGTSAIKNNPAYFGASVYFTAVLVVSHYYAIDAKKQLMRAKFEQDDLTMVIDTEIIPIVRFLDSVLIKGGAENGMKKFCSAKAYFRETTISAVDNLQKVRKNIETKMEESKSGEENNGFFQKLSVGGGAAGLVAVALAPCPFTAFLACPALIAGAAGAASGATGYYLFGTNKVTYQEAYERLDQARSMAMVAEDALRRARVNVDLACMELMMKNELPAVGNSNQLDLL